MEGIELERIVDYVREKYNIVVRTLDSKQAGTYGVRVSTPIYVSFKQIDMFLQGVRHLVQQRS